MAQVDATVVEDFGGTARFRVIRRLGAGGMGVVYEAWDAERRMEVALKVLRSMSAERLLMFKNEFRALADLAHPNLATLHQLFEHDGAWFFTMERVDGVPLLAYLRGGVASDDLPVSITRSATRASDDAATQAPTEAATAPAATWRPVEGRARPPVIDPAVLGPVFGQLARGLIELHRRGKVHRDIKPSNVLVTAAGRVVILDFGLVAAVGELAGPGRPALMGTPGYMAPEQAGGAWVGPPADWYALGVMLYQLLCGRLPFLGSAEDVVRAKQHIAPIPPRAINPEVPARLEALCLALLRPTPERRAGAAEVLEALGEPVAGADLGPSTGLGETGFVGRAAELGELDRALSDAALEPIAVLVRGESGIGKSALVAEWTTRLAEREPDVVVLVGRCHERESVPYKALDGVIDALARHLATRVDGGALARLGAAHRAVLARAFPALGGAPSPAAIAADEAKAAWRDVSSSWPSEAGPPGGGAAVEPAQVRRHLYAALRALFADVAAGRGRGRALAAAGASSDGAVHLRCRLVIVIDDLQWADDDGLALLAAALAPPGPPILVVATARDDDRRRDGLDAALALPGLVRVVELGGLVAADAAALAARWTRRDADQIAIEAGGHPLFIAELARSPQARAATVGGVASHEPRGARLEDALWRRIATLEPELRALLDVLAVAGQPLRQDLAAACAGIEPPRMIAVLSALREQTLIRTAGPSAADTVDAYHARVRDAVLAHLSAESRAMLHAILAARLEALAERDHEAVAEHWVEAGEPARALAFWIEGAQEAVAALAFDRAARLYRRALEACPEPARAHQLRLALGQALAHGGRGADAARVFRRAADDSDPASARELRRRAAEQLLRAGHVDEGLDGLREVLVEVGLDLPRDGRASIPRLLALRAKLRLRGYRLARPRTDALGKPRPADPVRSARIEACWTATLGLSMVDAVRGAEFQTRLLLGALGDGDAYHAALGLAMEAGHLSAEGAGNAARTAHVVDRARELAAATGSPHAMAMATGAAAMAAYLEGRFIDALELSMQGARLFRAHCVGATWERDTQLIVQAWARGYLGRLDELSRRLPSLVREAVDLGDLYLATSLQTGTLVVLPLSRDDAVSARKDADDAMRRWTHQGFLHQHWDDLLGQGEIDLYEGDAARAHRRILDGWPALKQAFVLMIQVSRCEAWSLRTRAALGQLRAARDGARSDARRLEAEVRAGLRALRGQAGWTVPLAALYAAGLAAAAGEVERAVRELRVAIAGFDGAHMALHAAIARHRLAALVGGVEADELVMLVRGYQRREGVADMGRMAAWIAPGFDAPS